MNASLVVGMGSAIAAIVSAILAYNSSKQANRTTEKKVDAEAFERSQQFYEKLLAEADKAVDRLRVQVERLQDQLDRVSNALSTEQGVSGILRTHVRALQQQVSNMESSIVALRTQLAPNQFGPVNFGPPVTLPPLPPMDHEAGDAGL